MSFETRTGRLLGLVAVALAVVALGAAVAGSRDRDEDVEAPEPPETPEAPDTPAPYGVYWAGDMKGAYLGVQVEEDTEGPEGGARITEIVDDSPAEHAGLAEGDVIVSFDGTTVRGPAGLTKQIRSRESGDKVAIVVLRDGKKKTIDAELGERASAWKVIDPGHLVDLEQLENLGPEIEERVRESLKGLERIELPEPGSMQWKQGVGFMRLGGRARLGVQLVEATPELREHFGGDGEAGVLVSKVIKGMPAEHAGVKVGDMIVAIDDVTIESVDDLREALADREGDTFGIEVIRDGERTRLEVSLPAEDEEDDSAGPRAFLPRPPPPAAPRPALAPGPLPRPRIFVPPRPQAKRVPPPLAV